LSVYNPTGSGNVHTDRVMSGRKPVAKAPAKKAMPAKAMPGKKAAAKKAMPGKKAAPFMKKTAGKAMADPAKVAKPAPKKGAAGGAMCVDPDKPAMSGKKVIQMKTQLADPAMPSKRQARVTKVAKARSQAREY
jgi:hypothetical protein